MHVHGRSSVINQYDQNHHHDQTSELMSSVIRRRPAWPSKCTVTKLVVETGTLRYILYNNKFSYMKNFVQSQEQAFRTVLIFVQLLRHERQCTAYMYNSGAALN